jgi:hypothetical protein
VTVDIFKSWGSYCVRKFYILRGKRSKLLGKGNWGTWPPTNWSSSWLPGAYLWMVALARQNNIICSMMASSNIPRFWNSLKSKIISILDAKKSVTTGINIIPKNTAPLFRRLLQTLASTTRIFPVQGSLLSLGKAISINHAAWEKLYKNPGQKTLTFKGERLRQEYQAFHISLMQVPKLKKDTKWRPMSIQTPSRTQAYFQR